MTTQRHEVSDRFESLAPDQRIYAELIYPPEETYSPNLFFRISEAIYQASIPGNGKEGNDRQKLLDDIVLETGEGESITFNFKDLPEAKGIPLNVLFDRIALAHKVYENDHNFLDFNTMVLFASDYLNVQTHIVGKALLNILLNPKNKITYGPSFLSLLDRDRPSAIHLLLTEISELAEREEKLA